MSTLTPLLVVSDVVAAAAFYVDAFAAREVARYTGREGVVTHVDVALGDGTFAVMLEAPAFGNDAALSLGGSPVVLQLRVEDLDAALMQVVRRGAALLAAPIDFCGDRLARVRDPFGHLWLLAQTLQSLSPDERQRRRNAFAVTHQT
jgi:PhnB protein